jgi:hypothetical protein
MTPNGFTTSHPQARPRGFETQSPTSRSSEVKDEGYSPSPLLKTHCIFWSSSGSPSAIPVALSPPHTSFLALSCNARSHVAQIPPQWSGLRDSTDGQFTPIPSLTHEEPPHLPSWRVIHSRAREQLWSLSQ